MSSEVLARSHLTGFFFFFSNLLQLQQQWALWMNVNAMFTWWSGSHRSPLSLCFVYLWFYSRLWWFFLGFILFHFCSIWSVPWLVPQWIFSSTTRPLLCLIFSSPHNRSFLMLHCSVRSIIFMILCCNVISCVDTKVTVSQMVIYGKWAQCEKKCSADFQWQDSFVL